MKMMTSSPGFWTFTLSMVFLSVVDFANTERYTFDLKLKYYANGYLTCDHPMLNITKRYDVQSLYWIFEDGSLVTPKSYLNPKAFILGGLPDGVSGASQPNNKYDGYNLTVLEVDDDVFGYYTCIVLFTNGLGHPRIAAIRYGLNIDGADFSDLLDEYEYNAMVGGIAAGVVLVLIGIVCLVWYKWCHEKIPDDDEDGVLREVEMEAKGEVKYDGKTYNNDGFRDEKADFDNEKNISGSGSEANSRL